MDVNCICLHGTWNEVRLSRMFHVVCIIHVTREHAVALALHMHKDIALCWVWSPIIIVDEWVVSSYFGRRPINDSQF